MFCSQGHFWMWTKGAGYQSTNTVSYEQPTACTILKLASILALFYAGHKSLILCLFFIHWSCSLHNYIKYVTIWPITNTNNVLCRVNKKPSAWKITELNFYRVMPSTPVIRISLVFHWKESERLLKAAVRCRTADTVSAKFLRHNRLETGIGECHLICW